MLQPWLDLSLCSQAGQLLSGEIAWVGDPTGPPAGSGLHPSAHRTYYDAFRKVGHCTQCTDYYDIYGISQIL